MRDIRQDWPAPLSGAEQLAICRELAVARQRVKEAREAKQACCHAQDLLGWPLAVERHREARREYEQIRNRLWETSMRLVVKWAARYAGPAISQDELVEIGTMRVEYAIERFDPDRGIQFSTYVSVALKREFVRAVQKAAKGRARERQLGVVGENLDGWDTIVGWTGTQQYDPAPYGPQELASVRSSLGEMPLREADVVLSRCRGERQATIARRHGISKERARQLEQQGLRRVAERIGVETVKGSLAKV